MNVCKTLCIGFLALFAEHAQSQPATMVLTATASGAFASDGRTTSSINPKLGDYAVGWDPKDFNDAVALRDYFVFDLSNVSGTITSATLDLYMPGPPNAKGYESNQANETYQVTTTSTTLASLTGIYGEGSTTGQAIFGTLGTGTVLGSTTVSAANQGTTVHVALNADALAFLNSNEGQSIAVSGQDPSAPTSGPTAASCGATGTSGPCRYFFTDTDPTGSGVFPQTPAPTLTLSFGTAPASGGVTFTDSTLDPSNYSIQTWKSDPGIQITVQQTQTGGNPGQALQLLYAFPAISGNSMVGLTRQSFSYDPATQGAIQSVSFSVDKYFTYTGCLTCYVSDNTARLLVLQNGVYYIATINIPGNGGNYIPASATGLEANDFGLFDFTTGNLNMSINPNFSSGVMQFGLASRYLFQFSAPATADVRYKNLTIDVQSAAPAGPTVTGVVDQAAGTTNLTPGMPVSVTGTGFGTSSTDVASVMIGTETAPVLSFVSSTNLIVQVPVDAPLGATTLTASYKGQPSAAFNIKLVTLAPEIEPAASATGSAFYDASGNPITSAHPGIPGTPVYLIAIGLGTTSPAQATNTVAASQAPTTQQVQVMVGSEVVQPTYAGLDPGGTPGYYQVLFTVPPDAAAGNLSVTLSEGGLTSNTQMLAVAPPLPVINAIVNGATFAAGTNPQAANSFVSLFGTNFGNANTNGNIFPATTFQGLSVLVNGTAIPLYVVAGTGGQINVVLPSELGTSGTASVEVMTAAGTSAAFQLALTADSVGIFRIADPSDPSRHNGAVLFTNTAWKVMPLSMAQALGLPSCSTVTAASICGMPAKAGDQIEIYLTGLGKATPNGDPNGKVLPTGSLAPVNGSVLYKTVETPKVTIGGVAAEVSFSGIAPGNAGQYQINVQVPTGVKPGDDVTLTVTMPDGSTDTVTIAITGS